MGYFTKPIAKESVSPALFSLSSNPNFIQFESLYDTQSAGMHKTLEVIDTSVDISKTVITVTETETGDKHVFAGTRSRDEINDVTFFVDTETDITAENIRACLLGDEFIRSNFYVTIPVKIINGEPVNGNTIEMYSIRPNVSGYCTVAANADFIQLSQNIPNENTDTIDGGKGNTDIEMDFFTETGVFAGENDIPKDGYGKLISEVSKRYSGFPVWFDINEIAKNSIEAHPFFMESDTWVNSGTFSDFRFIGRRNDGENREMFYISNVFYILHGYDRNLEQNDLSNYVFNTELQNSFLPLTKQPVLPHVKGQTQLFSFILSDPNRQNDLGTNEYNLGILYRVQTQSKQFITDVIKHEQSRKDFSVVNTIKLQIDDILELYPKAAHIDVYLCRNGAIRSSPLSFYVLPACFYKVKDFAFLNSLGGWSSFNFAGTESTDFKTETETISKTQTPDYKIYSQIESVFIKEVEEQFTAVTGPINKAVCDWLKELSASVAVYELSTKRYVIVDEINIKSNTKDDLFTLQMKYRYSDKYNALT